VWAKLTTAQHNGDEKVRVIMNVKSAEWTLLLVAAAKEKPHDRDRCLQVGRLMFKRWGGGAKDEINRVYSECSVLQELIDVIQA